MAKFEQRRAPADERDVSYTDAGGTTHTLHPNADGLFSPKDAQADAVLESFGFERVGSESAKPKSTRRSAPKKRGGKRDTAAIARKSAATRAARKAAADGSSPEAPRDDGSYGYPVPDEPRADETRES